MGSQSSRNAREIEATNRLRREASINFHNRIKNYHYAYHGDYIEYVEWCRGQYEFECLPEFCRQGRRYNPQNDCTL